MDEDQPVKQPRTARPARVVALGAAAVVVWFATGAFTASAVQADPIAPPAQTVTVTVTETATVTPSGRSSDPLPPCATTGERVCVTDDGTVTQYAPDGTIEWSAETLAPDTAPTDTP